MVGAPAKKKSAFAKAAIYSRTASGKVLSKMLVAQGFLDLFCDAAPHISDDIFQSFELSTEAAFDTLRCKTDSPRGGESIIQGELKGTN